VTSKPVTLLTTKLIEAFCPDALEDLGDGDGADGITQEASKQLKTLNDWLCVIWFSGVLVS